MTNSDVSGFQCLILEDEPPLAGLLSAAIEAIGGKVVVCSTIAQATQTLQNREFEVFVLDNYLPDGKGEAFFCSLISQGVYSPCIMITGVPELETAVRLTRFGLFDYLSKPPDVAAVQAAVKRALLNYGQAKSSLATSGIVAVSPAMKYVHRLACQAAGNPATTVLLTGETGVGKDVVARLIHRLTFPTGSADSPLVTLNCSAIPADVFEAELFGAQRGAFTGALKDRMGLAESAREGTLFLDEIGEVSLTLQAKLLQFLETREFRRLGCTVTQVFKGRIIAATNRSLEAEVKQGRFREDLWYRLDVLNIPIPPLRERPEDIPALVDALLENIAKKNNRPKPWVRPEEVALLQKHSFPGNARELRNLLERSLVLTSADSKWLQIDPAWLRKTGLVAAAPPSACSRSRGPTPNVWARTTGIQRHPRRLARRKWDYPPCRREAGRLPSSPAAPH